MGKGASLRDRAAAADAVEPVVSSKASIPSAFAALGEGFADVAFKYADKAFDENATANARRDAVDSSLLFNGLARACFYAAAKLEAAQ